MRAGSGEESEREVAGGAGRKGREEDEQPAQVEVALAEGAAHQAPPFVAGVGHIVREVDVADVRGQAVEGGEGVFGDDQGVDGVEGHAHSGAADLVDDAQQVVCGKVLVVLDG